MQQDDLRLMRPDEVEAATALLLRANEEHLAAFPEEVARGYRDELAAVGSQWATAEAYVVVRDGELLGTVTLVRDAGRDAHPWPAGGAVLRFLAVEPDARGSGVGERLTAVCIARAREEGATFLALHTAPGMLAARRLYERLGFVRVAEHDFDPAAHYAGAADPAEPPWGLAYLLRLEGS
jgi:ribosomal protein S18 acetylase RimI-like enzyme